MVYGNEIRDSWHLHIILSGKGTFRAGGQTFHPHFGQIFLIKDGEHVFYRADEQDPWHYCWVTFGGTEAKRLTEEIGFGEGIYVLDSSVDASEFYRLISHMHEKPEMNYINDLRRRGILLEFLSLALESTSATGQSRVKQYEYSPEVYVQRAVDFIHYNYASIRVADIIEYVGFTRSYFSTMFKKQTGTSLQEYLLQVRMKEASNLLESTALPVHQIAGSVGYEDALAFSKMFKKYTGKGPKEYRESLQK